MRQTSRRAKITSRASLPVGNVISVPVTAVPSVSSASSAQDIRPRPTATPRDCSAEGPLVGETCELEDDEALEI